MTEDELKTIGFEFERSYVHDQYHTNRYKKGILEIEFTYKDDELLTCHMTMEEINCKPITLEEMKIIDRIFGDE
jgi:hypothetical protein